MHRLAALAEPVDVDDRGQVVELVVGRRARTPPRSSPRPSRCRRTAPRRGTAAGRAACRRARPRPPIGRPWPSEPVATSTHGSTGVGWPSSRLPELAEGEQLLVGDRAGRLEHRVQQRRRVALGEDQVVVARVVRLVEVVAQVLGEQHGHQVGRGHRRGRVAGLRPRPRHGPSRRAAAVPARARARALPCAGNVTVLSESRSPSTTAASSCASGCWKSWRRSGTRPSISAPTNRSRGSTTRTRRARSAEAIRSGDAERAVLVCGSGVGASVAANKLAGIRAADLPRHLLGAPGRRARRHERALPRLRGDRRGARGRARTRLPLGGFDGGERYVRRLEKIEEMEREPTWLSHACTQLSELGQSVWIDSSRATCSTSGELERLMREDAVVGVTSNPTIFQKAIAEGDAYDEQLREVLAEAGRPEGGLLRARGPGRAATHATCCARSGTAATARTATSRSRSTRTSPWTPRPRSTRRSGCTSRSTGRTAS